MRETDFDVQGLFLRRVEIENRGLHADLRDVTMVDGRNAFEVLQQLSNRPDPSAPPLEKQLEEIIKTAIENAFQGYEQVSTATRQAVQVVEEQIAKATEQVGGAQPAKAKKK